MRAPTIPERIALARLPNSPLHPPKWGALDIVLLFFQFRVSNFEFLLSIFRLPLGNLVGTALQWPSLAVILWL